MAEVDQHAEPVHLLHDVDAERAEPVILGIVGGAVGPFGGLVVGQRHVARAEPVELRSAASEPPIWRPPSIPISEATRPLLWMRTMSSAVNASSRSFG